MDSFIRSSRELIAAGLGSRRYATIAAAGLFLLPVVAAWAPDPSPKSVAESKSYTYSTRRAKNAMTQKRQRHVTLKLGADRIFIFAGFANSHVELLDLKTETVKRLACEHGFGDFTGIAMPSGKALLVDGDGTLFDPAVGQFAEAANVYDARGARWTPLVMLPDGSVFLCGAHDGEFKPLDVCSIFHPGTLTFEPIGKMAIPRACHAATRISDHEVLISGGTGADYIDRAYDTLEIFDIKARSSRLLPVKMASARSSHASILLSDGTVLLAGGYCPQSRDDVRSAEIFDPKTEKLTAVQPLGLGRGETHMERLSSGRIAVVGGRFDCRVIEIYDPERREFVLADQLMMDPRDSGFTLTSLNDGRLLVAGGRVNSSDEELDGVEFITETSRVAENRPATDASDLIRHLGDEKFAVREAATRKLLKMGLAIKGSLEPLLKNEDPEVRHRAKLILDALSGGESKPWRVEVWKEEQKVAALDFSDYKFPGRREEADPRFVKIKNALAPGTMTQLVVRFPDGLSHQKRAQMFELVGWTRFPIVQLGKACGDEPAE